MKLRIILPGECPYNCIWCYKEGIFTGRQKQLDTSDFVYLTKKAGEIGFDQFKATGGEPTNYPSLLEIIRAARDSHYTDIRMTTIGIKLAEIEFCKSLSSTGLDGVTITVNTFNPETYARLTRAKKENFELMRTGLENAVSLFGHSVTLNTVLSRETLDDIPRLIEYASKRGLGVKVLEMLNEEGITPPNMYVSLDEFKSRFKIGNGKLINPTRELIRIGGARVYLVNSCCARQECDVCRKGYQVVRVTPDGKLKTCISHELNELDAFEPIKSRNDKKLEELLVKAIKKFKE